MTAPTTKTETDPICTGEGECKDPTDLHSCPYQEDVEDNHEDYCDCCAACEDACGDNI